MITKVSIDSATGIFTLIGTLEKPTETESGKSYSVLTSSGNQPVKDEKGKEYKYGLNVFIPIPKAERRTPQA
jgi:hypothetical protein